MLIILKFRSRKDNIFIDKKIKMDKRDSWPIVVDSKGKIVWIPGIKKSIFDKKNYEPRRVFICG